MPVAQPSTASGTDIPSTAQAPSVRENSADRSPFGGGSEYSAAPQHLIDRPAYGQGSSGNQENRSQESEEI